MGNKKSITKNDIVKNIWSKGRKDVRLTQAQIDYVITEAIREIIGAAQDGKRVIFKGFGTFSKISRKARAYKTPTGQTGRTIEMEKLMFVASNKVTDLFNED